MATGALRLAEVVRDKCLRPMAGVEAWRGSCRGRTCVVRQVGVNDAQRWAQLRREAACAAYWGDLPRVMACGREGEVAFLVQEDLAGIPLPRALLEDRALRKQLPALLGRMFLCLSHAHEFGLGLEALAVDDVYGSTAEDMAWNPTFGAGPVDAAADVARVAAVARELWDAYGRGEAPRILAEVERGEYASARAVAEALGSSDTPRATFVGRTRERAELDHLFADAVGGSHGCAVAVVGDPGQGKSSLLRDRAERWRAEKCCVVAVRADEAGGAFGVARRLVAEIMNAVDRGMAECAAEAFWSTVERARRTYPEGAALVWPDGVGPGASPEIPAGRRVASEQAAAFCAELLQNVGPAVVMLDDLQDVDIGTVDTLGPMVAALRDDPVLVVGASRRDPAGRRAVETWRAQMPASLWASVALKELDRADVAAMIEAALRSEAEVALVEAVLESAGGLPLATAEVLRAGLRAGAFAPRDGAWGLDADAWRELDLRDGAVGLYARILAKLDDDVLAVVRALVVLGPPYSVEHVAEMLELPQVGVRRALSVAAAAGLFRGGRPAHARVDEQVRRSTPDATLAGLRERAACVLLTAREDDPETIAWHFANGDESTAAQIRRDALCAGAARAHERWDRKASRTLYGLAESAAAAGGTTLADEDQLRYAEALAGAHEPELAADRFVAVHSGGRDPLTRARAAMGLSALYLGDHNYTRALEWSSAVLQELGEPPIRASLWTGTAAFVRIVLLNEGRRLARRPPVDALDSPGATLRAQALHVSGRVAMELNQLAWGFTTFGRAARVPPNAGGAGAWSEALATCAAICGFAGRGREARELFDVNTRVCTKLNRLDCVVTACSMHSATVPYADDLPQTLTLAQRIVGPLRPWATPEHFTGAYLNIDIVHAALGRVRKAWVALSQARDAATDPDVDRRDPEAAACSGIFYFRSAVRAAELGDPNAARRYAALGFASPGTNETTPRASWVLGSRLGCAIAGVSGESVEDVEASYAAASVNPRSSHAFYWEFFINSAHHYLREVLLAVRSDALADLRRANARLKKASRGGRVTRGSYELGHAVARWAAGRSWEPALKRAEAIAESLDSERIRVDAGLVRAFIARHAGAEGGGLEHARAAFERAMVCGMVSTAQLLAEHYPELGDAADAQPSSDDTGASLPRAGSEFSGAAAP